MISLKKNIFILILAISSFIFSKDLGYIIKDNTVVYREEIEGTKKEYELPFINKENFEILITGNPQIALILLKLFCKRIYDQKRRLKILVIEDTQARIADVFLMFAEMQPNADPNERTMRFNLTIQDISHWAGLPVDTVRDEVNRFVEKHKIEVYDTYIVVNNIVDMRRIVDTRAAIRSV